MNKRIVKTESTLKVNPGSYKEIATVVPSLRQKYMELIYQRRENLSPTQAMRRNESFYKSIITTGDLAAAKTLLDSVDKYGLEILAGTMSSDPVQQAKYLLVSSITMHCRIAMDAGLPSDIAYSISDIFLQYTDTENDIKKLILASVQSIYEYTLSVRNWGVRNCSPPIRNCIDYIFDNLHYSISMDDLSRVSGLSANYLSDLFNKEMGMRPTTYIRESKLKYACFLLETSDKSISEISALLAFPSPSAFTSFFRKNYGVTPKEWKYKAC